MTTAPHIRDLAALLAKPSPPPPAPRAPSTSSEPTDPPRTKSPQRQADPQRQARGRQSHAQGVALEGYLLASGKRAGLYIVHVPTPGQIVSRRGREVTARLEAPVAPDFVGMLPGGRGFAMEVKTTSEAGGRWTLHPRLRLPDVAHPKRGHQGQELLRVRAQGGAAAVYLRAVTLACDFLIPVGVEGSPDLSAPSWSWDDLARWRVPSHGRWWEALT